MPPASHSIHPRKPLTLGARRVSNFVAYALALFALPAAGCDEIAATSAIYRATHNSYSGNIKGTRGSIIGQLDGGVRFLEFDVHDNGYGDTHDYQIGHNSPGNEVDHAVNGLPSGANSLRDWLALVANWSPQEATPAGVVVMLDLKDDLTDNPSFAAGNLGALNAEITSVFGSRLFSADAVGGTFPTVGALRGKILCLLSGHSDTRLAYRRDLGHHPAVAMNASGQVVEVHDSGGGDLWYWTGIYGADGRIAWRRHGRYDTGVTPAVALADDGYLVEVHQSENESSLWYHVGHLDADGEITWSPSRRYDSGILPTLRFVNGGVALREIHRSESHNQNWDWDGTLDRNAWTVAWNASTHGTTSDPRYDVASSSVGASSVAVYNGADGSAPADTLRYATDRVPDERIRYVQTAFVEYQDSDPDALKDGAWFYGAPATNSSFIINARNAGRLVRGWDFESLDLETTPLANFPATNTPGADWYEALMSENAAVQ